ncbi:hypothetical protein Btru_070381 [Bulinus truncatus]|nr:hypothetical protein Btru_070381 [Bulinus truncatus]
MHGRTANNETVRCNGLLTVLDTTTADYRFVNSTLLGNLASGLEMKWLKSQAKITLLEILAFLIKDSFSNTTLNSRMNY